MDTRAGTRATRAVNIVSNFVDKILKYNVKKIKVTSGSKFACIWILFVNEHITIDFMPNTFHILFHVVRKMIANDSKGKYILGRRGRSDVHIHVSSSRTSLFFDSKITI